MLVDLKKHVTHIGDKTVHFILPPICPATGELVDKIGMVSPEFWQSLSFIQSPFCVRCGTPFEYEAIGLTCASCIETPPIFNTNRSAIIYNDASKNIILRFKHGDQTHAVKTFDPWLRQVGDEMMKDCDIFMPVPLHTRRLIKRRYNQSDLIGRELSKSYPDKLYIPDGLRRVKNTQSQGFKNQTEREKNVKNAFKANPKYDFKGKKIILIDDVYTTGATLNECAKTLYSSGALEVNCLTLARVVKT